MSLWYDSEEHGVVDIKGGRTSLEGTGSSGSTSGKKGHFEMSTEVGCD